MVPDVRKELEAVLGMKNGKDIREAMEKIANKIHPDATKLASLTSALKRFKDVHEVLELSDDLSDRFCNLEIDFYSLIKDINTEKNVPEGMMRATEEVLKRPNDLL
jgi:DnaJ-class molecular chaperone